MFPGRPISVIDRKLKRQLPPPRPSARDGRAAVEEICFAPMNTGVPHIVRVSRRREFSSSTLPEQARVLHESAFRGARWWRDRWAHRPFRDAARQVLHVYGGLALIGPDVTVEAPSPFVEMFEPIEITGGVGEDAERLLVLSGEAPTRPERRLWVLKLFAIVIGLGMFGILVLAFMGGVPIRAIPPIGAAIGVASLAITIALFAQSRSGRWFLVPCGIAIVRRPVRRGQPGRITVLSRWDTCAALRYVSTGKTVVLMLELWTHAGKTLRRSVSEREAAAVLAAWQSPLTPPSDEKLMELVTW